MKNEMPLVYHDLTTPHPMKSLAHMLSQFFRLTLATLIWLGLLAWSQVRCSMAGALSSWTWRIRHSRKTRLLSTMEM